MSDIPTDDRQHGDDQPVALPEPVPEVTLVPVALTRRVVDWGIVVAAVVAALVGFGGAAVIGDARTDDRETTSVALGSAVALPVLVPGVGAGAGLSSAGSDYGVGQWSSGTRAGVLGSWGAAFADVRGADAPEVLPVDGTALLADDPRVADPAAPGFVDPCSVRRAPDGCPDATATRRGVVLGADPHSSNTVAVHPYPRADVASAGPCDFVGVADDQVPVAVVTSEPGSVVVTVGNEQATATTTAAERAEWDEWQRHPVGNRPLDSLVTHCVVVPRPDGSGPFPVRAEATDDAGDVVVAEAAIAPVAPGLPPVVFTPIDGTMLRVDVPRPPGSDRARVVALPLAALGGVADCDTAVGVAGALGASTGWRRGARIDGAAAVDPDGASGARPYLAGAPSVDRVTIALSEGEPNLVCADLGPGSTLVRAALVATPPDARRLTLSVGTPQLTGEAGDTIEVRGTFPSLGWLPCGTRLEGVTGDPGRTTQLCTSGGDSGAIAAAGGLLDLSVRLGTGRYTARIVLDARADGAPVEQYRLPIPAPALADLLCTAGVTQGGCVAPDVTTTIGTVDVFATWDEGPLGPAAWVLEPPSV